MREDREENLLLRNAARVLDVDGMSRFLLCRFAAGRNDNTGMRHKKSAALTFKDGRVQEPTSDFLCFYLSSSRCGLVRCTCECAFLTGLSLATVSGPSDDANGRPAAFVSIGSFRVEPTGAVAVAKTA